MTNDKGAQVKEAGPSVPVEITGLAPADIIGIHTYCRDDVLEIIDARYLTRLPKIETAVETVSEAKP